MAHYKIHQLENIDNLRTIFPNGKADKMNFCLFSTSGVHGSYKTIEELDFTSGDGDTLTVLVVQPRLVSMTYGEILVQEEDVDFLKNLRKSSWKIASSIGA